MADVRPLKKNLTTGLPRQVQADSDRIIAKGVVFEGDTNVTIEKDGTDLKLKDTTAGESKLIELQSFSRVTANDTTPNYLLNKFVEGDNIQIEEGNDGGDEFIKVAVVGLTGGDFQEFFDETDDSTGSNGYVTVATFLANLEENSRYEFNGIIRNGQTDKEKKFSIRIEYRRGTSGTWIRPVQETLAVATDDSFLPIPFKFFVDNTSTQSDYQIRVRHGDTDDGGNSEYDFSRITVFKVGDV